MTRRLSRAMMRLSWIMTGFCVFMASCKGIHFNNRSVVYYTEQHSSTEGRISSSPKSESASVDAEKTNDLKIDHQKEAQKEPSKSDAPAEGAGKRD